MTRLKAPLATLAAALATLAGLDLTGFLNLLPPQAAKWLVILPSAAATLLHLIDTLRKTTITPAATTKIVPIIALLPLLTLTSCITTTTPDGTRTTRLDTDTLRLGITTTTLAKTYATSSDCDSAPAPTLITPEK